MLTETIRYVAVYSGYERLNGYLKLLGIIFLVDRIGSLWHNSCL